MRDPIDDLYRRAFERALAEEPGAPEWRDLAPRTTAAPSAQSPSRPWVRLAVGFVAVALVVGIPVLLWRDPGSAPPIGDDTVPDPPGADRSEEQVTVDHVRLRWRLEVDMSCEPILENEGFRSADVEIWGPHDGRMAYRATAPDGSTVHLVTEPWFSDGTGLPLLHVWSSLPDAEPDPDARGFSLSAVGSPFYEVWCVDDQGRTEPVATPPFWRNGPHWFRFFGEEIPFPMEDYTRRWAEEGELTVDEEVWRGEPVTVYRGSFGNDSFEERWLDPVANRWERLVSHIDRPSALSPARLDAATTTTIETVDRSRVPLDPALFATDGLFLVEDPTELDITVEE